MKKIKKQKGLGLIETIIVVTIIGILSALVISKYLSTKTSANISQLQSMKASLSTAINLTYKKAAIANKAQKMLSEVSLGDNTSPVLIRYGYPQAQWSELKKVLQLSKHDWHFQVTDNLDLSRPASITLWSTLGRGSVSTCNIRYQGAINLGNRPLITINTKGCQPI